MIEFAKLDAEERALYFQQAAERTQLAAHLIEKDFWVCLSLHLLFSNQNLAHYLTFKGGTSLSKVYGAIDRFSEDIDFAVSREALGFDEKTAPDANGISNAERQRRLSKMGIACSEWVRDKLVPAFKSAMIAHLASDGWSIDWIEEAHHNQQVVFSYPKTNLTRRTAYNPDRVRIELTARTDNHPAKPAQVTSYLAKQFPDAFTNATAKVEVLRIERTFWEKATILHQFHFQSDPARITSGFSRHYYDIHQLAQRGYADSAIQEIELLPEVADHKNLFYPQPWAKYDLARVPQTLELMPHENIVSQIAADYDAMQEMIFGSRPSFDEILNTLRDLKSRINAIND